VTQAERDVRRAAPADPPASTTSPTVTDAGGSAGDDTVRNPWERFGVVMRSVWLVFLIYPLLAVLGVGSWMAKAYGVLLIAAFVVVYVFGMERLDARQERRYVPASWSPTRSLVLLTLLALAEAPVIGLDALGFAPFVLSFAMFALPVRWAFAVCGVCVAVVLLLPLTLGRLEEWWSFGVVVLSVGVAVGLVRVATEAGERFEQVRDRLAVVAERERVARDVHDVLGHSLTVVTLKAELAERLVDRDPERARAELVEIQTLTRQALAEIRETVGGLRAARLDHELDSARSALAAAGIASNLAADGALDVGVVDPRHRMVLAWVLREAVTNVVRHSDADRCDVELGTARLVVTDDGRGVEGRPEGNGIRGLRERVAAAGGTVSLQTGRDGHGTVLEVTM
jgi:two-component system sensor histidine kinase DesK